MNGPKLEVGVVGVWRRPGESQSGNPTQVVYGGPEQPQKDEIIIARA